MKRAVVFVLCCFMLCSSALAELTDEEDLKNAVPESVRGLTDDFDSTRIGAFSDELLSAIKEKLTEELVPSLRTGISIILAASVCSIVGIFCEEDIPSYIPLCGCAAATVLCAGNVGSYTGICTAAINDISSFADSILPAMCAAGAAGGAVASSAVKYAASALFMDILIKAVSMLILPLISLYIAVSAASGAFGNRSLAGASRLIKQLCTLLMTAVTVVFTVYLGTSSAIASGGDAVAMKVTKTAISTALPVVGGILSDAASAVVAGAGLIKAGAGAFGMAAVLAICVLPFAVLGLNFLVFKACALCVNALCDSRIAAVVDSFGTAYGMMLGCVGSCALILFISILSCIRTVTG